MLLSKERCLELGLDDIDKCILKTLSDDPCPGNTKLQSCCFTVRVGALGWSTLHARLNKLERLGLIRRQVRPGRGRHSLFTVI